jgi:hypothetical protein
VKNYDGLPDTSGRVFLVLELLHDPRDRQGYIGYQVSIPGRSSALKRLWKAPHGIISDRELEDLVGAVGKTISDTVVTWVGTQEALPMP